MNAAIPSVLAGVFLAFAGLATSFDALSQTAQPLTVSCSSSSALFSTGYDHTTQGALSQNQQDPYWGFAFAGSPVTNPPTPLASISAGAWTTPTVYWTTPWSTSPYSNANWISPLGFAGSSSQRWGYYRYQFKLDPSVNPADLSLQLSYLVDDAVTEIYVNGIAQSAHGAIVSPSSIFSTPPVSRTLVQDWKPGLNEVVFLVQDYGWVTGLLVQAEPKALCKPTTVDISKTASAAQVAQGGSFSYGIVLANQGSQSATVTQLTDTPPAGITLNSWTCAASNGASCPAPNGSGAPNLTNLTLPAAAVAGNPGGTLTFTVQASADANATLGPLVNTVQATPNTNTTLCSAASGGASAAQCVATASINVVKPVTPADPPPPNPVPVDAPWALLALGGLLAGLGVTRAAARRSA